MPRQRKRRFLPGLALLRRALGIAVFGRRVGAPAVQIDGERAAPDLDANRDGLAVGDVLAGIIAKSCDETQPLRRAGRQCLD